MFVPFYKQSAPDFYTTGYHNNSAFKQWIYAKTEDNSIVCELLTIA